MLRLISRTGLCLSVIAGLGLATTTLPSPAIADKPAHAGKGNGHGKHKGGNSNKAHKNKGNAPAAAAQSNSSIDVNIVFDTGAKQAVRSHYSNSYAGKSCPPGLAKKNNGCLPPGQDKKYNRGDVVPASVTLYRLPGALEVKLKPLPAGYVYRYVDGEVLVVAEAARKVIDAVVLLSML
jgi:hypothetical protein